jgi:hypothetical protein
MFELIPVGAGAVLGVLASSWPSRLPRVAFALAIVLVGAVASAASGELAESPVFLLFDTALTLGCALAARRLVSVTGRRQVA